MLSLKLVVRKCTLSACAQLKSKFYIQSTLVISKPKGLSTTLRDIRTSTYQICSFEEKQFEQPNFTNDYVIRLLKLELYIENIVEKGRNCSPGAISPLFHKIL